jgi:putative transposase
MPGSPFRDVEDLLAEPGIMVSYETVRRWVKHFGSMIAADLRRRRPKPHSTWRKLLKKMGFVPDKLVTYDLRSYGAAARDLGISHQPAKSIGP